METAAAWPSNARREIDGAMIVVLSVESALAAEYDTNMIIIRFHDEVAERKALGFLAGRFSFRTWSSGDVMVPENALAYLAHERIRFLVEGPATYAQLIPPIQRPVTDAESLTLPASS